MEVLFDLTLLLDKFYYLQICVNKSIVTGVV